MRKHVTVDGNEAAASVAHRTNEVIALYPITPPSTMGDLADEWASKARTNIWGAVPSITVVPAALIAAHRRRALTPDAPVLRGTAQNPDTYFQSREAANTFYAACPEIVQATMNRFADLVGRPYRLFEYAGHPNAERVIVI